MANTTKTNILKRELLKALEASLGVITQACKMVGCNRSTFYTYMKEDPEFAKKVTDLENVALDFAESKLYKQIEKENITAIIFYLKTKGKHRGYVERHEHTGADGEALSLSINIQGKQPTVKE
jgi:hypothetical protein